MNKKGILVVVSGFSGAGKGCLMKALLNSYDCYALSVSATTRDPREGEINGREYFFVTEERFREMIEQEALYEYAEYQNHFYGTPRSYVDDRLNEGKDVILEIDVQGAETIKERFPDTVLIFITPPSAKELERRLVERGSETPDKIRGRLLRAVEEAKYMPFYDYILINDDLEECTKELHAIIQSEHTKSARDRDFIIEISDELRKITNTKGEDAL